MTVLELYAKACIGALGDACKDDSVASATKRFTPFIYWRLAIFDFGDIELLVIGTRLFKASSRDFTIPSNVGIAIA